MADYQSGIWTFETRDWHGSARQTLRRLPENRLELACDCTRKQAKLYCNHLSAVIGLTIEHLGADCLQPDHRERRIAQVLADYGMTLQDDYAVFFDFSLGPQGWEAAAKVPDLMPLHFSLAERTIPSDAPSVKPSAPKAGLILAFNFEADLFSGFVLYYAALKKNGGLAASLKPIHESAAAHILLGGDLPEEAKDIWYAVASMNDQYREFARTGNVAMLGRTVADFNRLRQNFPDLPLLAGEGRAYAHITNLNKLTPIRIAPKPAELRYRLAEAGGLYRLEGCIVLDGKALNPDALHKAASPFFIYCKGTLAPYPDAQTAADIMRCIAHPSMAVLKRHAETLRQNIIAPLSKHYEISSSNFVEAPKPRRKKSEPAADHTDTAFEKQVYVRETDGLIRFSPAAQYSDSLIELPSHGLRLRVENDAFCCLPRAEAEEQAFLAFFESLHPDFHRQNGRYALRPEQLADDFWFLDFAAALQQYGTTLLGAKDLKSWRYNLNKPQLSIRTESGTDWFDLKAEIRYGEQTVSLKELQKAFVKKQNFITLADGSIGMLPESWLAKLAPYFQAGEVKKDGIRLSHLHFGIIAPLLDTLEEQPEFLRTLYERKERLHHLSAQENVPLSDGLNTTLRPYQQQGLNWLAFYTPTAWAAVWPTTWAWAKPCKPSPFCII